ncbi:hypothetical protein N7G274_003608 [Stereocaulon virgatum]|uniref:ADP-ribosylation factor n=1 Tax=Stereocaulon virgatum TaxID=373712 RepID=A0ABR4ABR8_9LECA
MATAAKKPEMLDFDDDAAYQRCENAVKNKNTKNFVIEFDNETARASLELNEAQMQGFLETERLSTASTRWINIWALDNQEPVLKRLAERYKFSPRLSGIMRSNHNIPLPVAQKPVHIGLRQRIGIRKSVDARSSDIEMFEDGATSPIQSPLPDLSHYKLVNEVWHYCSVDWGSRYLCIGYNSLSDVEVGQKSGHESAGNYSQAYGDDAEAQRLRENNPKGARTWTWLVLCDDGTLISIYENPFPGHPGDLDEKQTARLLQIRRNLLNVFKQLSNVNNKSRRNNPINTLDIRPGLVSNQTSNITIADSPGLLLYYLFDDWYTSYALVAKEEHQYARLLEDLRLDMFTKPHVQIVQQLHQYGRQLGVLKRMYQSYAMIIDRILARQKPVYSSSGDTANASNSGHQTKQLFQESNAFRALSFNEDTTTDSPTFGVRLSAAATVRFERLRDRINHYAISEIQECLDEKEALVFLNFNMITLKQSQAVERLTRITILLAKVTILFMPVSLMTGYFSTQIQDLQGIYTAKTYWVCFAVIMALSFIFLVAFGVLSGTLEGKPIYRSLTETVLDAGNLRWKERKGKKHG